MSRSRESIFHALTPTPTPTDHALERWDERTSPESVAIETAWREAWQMSQPDDAHCPRDRFQFHEPERVVLIARNAAILTVLSLREMTATDPIRIAVERQFGLSEDE